MSNSGLSESTETENPLTVNSSLFTPPLFSEIPLRKAKPKTGPRSRKVSLPSVLDELGSDSNQIYLEALQNPKEIIEPQLLGLIPSAYWNNIPITFGDLVTKFFQRKNWHSCRFHHKLYNALMLTNQNPSMFGLVGVKWLNDVCLLCDKYVFGRLLAIQSVDGGLFHKQGNFSNHGFEEVLTTDGLEGVRNFNLSIVDFDRYKILKHKTGLWTRKSSEKALDACKWGAL